MEKLTTSIQHTQKSDTKTSHEWRCECGRLLFKGAFLVGLIEVKCPRCKKIVYLQEYNTFTTDKQSCMLIMDLKGNILTSNTGLSAMLGYSLEDTVGHNLVELIDPKVQPVMGFWLKKIAGLRDSARPYIIAVINVINSKKGKVQLTFFAKCIDLNGRLVILAIAEKGDKAAERYAKNTNSSTSESEGLQREIWDYIIDETGHVKTSSGLSSLGYADEDVTGKSIFSLFDSLTGEQEAQMLKDLKDGLNFVYTGNILTKSGDHTKSEVCFTTDFLAKEEENDFTVSFSPTQG